MPVHGRHRKNDMYDQNYINEEVVMHRRVLINIANALGVSTQDLVEREDQLAGAVMRRMRAHFADPKGRPQPSNSAARHLSVPLTTSLVLLDHHVWSLQALLSKQWDLVALDAVPGNLGEDEHQIAVAEALAGVDYTDLAQHEAVVKRVRAVLSSYVNTLVFNCLDDTDLTSEDHDGATDTHPVEGPFAAYHRAAARLAQQHFATLVLVEAGDEVGSYHERWAGLARDPLVPSSLRLSLGIVPQPLAQALRDPKEYALITNKSGSRAQGNSGAPDTVCFKLTWSDRLGLGHSPLDAMAHYLADEDEEGTGGFWQKVRARLR